MMIGLHRLWVACVFWYGWSLKLEPDFDSESQLAILAQGFQPEDLNELAALAGWLQPKELDALAAHFKKGAESSLGVAENLLRQKVKVEDESAASPKNGTRTWSLTKHGRGKKKVACDASDIDMAELALKTCYLQRNDPSKVQSVHWDLQNWTLSGLLVSAVFSNSEKHCVLAFSGNVFGFDDLKNLRIKKMYNGLIKPDGKNVTRTVCGRHVHTAFYDDFAHHMSSKGWKMINRILTSDTCSAGISVTGSSLGSAATELTADCARSGSLSELQGESLPTFNISDQVTSFGGVGVVLHDKASKAATNGRRFIIEDDFAYQLSKAMHADFPTDTTLYLNVAEGKSSPHVVLKPNEATKTLDPWLKSFFSLAGAIGNHFEYHRMETYLEAVQQACSVA